MKRERRSIKSFLSDTMEYQESKQIPELELDSMVTKLREGDRTMINPIIRGHYRLVMGILGTSVRSRQRQADIEGAAFLALVETVNDCCPHTDSKGQYHESRLYDNNITYYITDMVKYAIKEEYGNDHVMRMPPRTIRYKIAQGQKFEDIVPGDGLAIATDKGDSSESSEASIIEDGFVMPFFIPIARVEFPSLEFTDALTRCVENEMERAIVKLRSEGYTYEEVGKKVGLSTGRIGHLMPPIEARFDRLYK